MSSQFVEAISFAYHELSQSPDMTFEKMRQYLIERYPNSKSWSDKVKKMPDAQVYQIYVSIKEREERRKKS